MKKILVKCNTNDEVIIDNEAKTNGITITLVDEKGIPVAKYEFDSKKTLNLTRLQYCANNIRIHFYGDIIPSKISELSNSTFGK